MDYDKLLDEIEHLQIAAYSNNRGTNEEQLEVRTEIIKLLQSKVNVSLGSVSKNKPLPPPPPKDREIHISGESRYKR